MIFMGHFTEEDLKKCTMMAIIMVLDITVFVCHQIHIQESFTRFLIQCHQNGL